ncbi:hypothetical protein [Xenorhabdus bovienii]|uniref:hypothetical protein n=1 Tax=Xenorhabdus bovienii TaxID=40576 RepID=UPI0023B29BDF|nr:hypothetical protein [Xenorhabdus bovienii]MDE9527969.1 hypothetical protein [Xenorhabdus bovienii]MDE9536915.1 hypothetical protein [Xenorhabdus bovienii]MDE9571292.1 hypothetical protein [Xenorhabdus bovienii]MDE9589920.1 hypothetical protein [Xenorhabdus bovienii]
MKSTTLDQLNSRWNERKKATHNRAYNAAGRPSKERWYEIVIAHGRRVKRGRIVKNNAAKVAGRLNELQTLSWLIRNNRELSGLPPMKFVFGNSGTAKNWDENGNYQELS